VSAGNRPRVTQLFLAAERRPDVQGLGLERVGVRLEEGVPVHDEYLRTTNPVVFVAGDVAGPPALLHTAHRLSAGKIDVPFSCTGNCCRGRMPTDDRALPDSRRDHCRQTQVC
jgi:hypothetical protein